MTLNITGVDARRRYLVQTIRKSMRLEKRLIPRATNLLVRQAKAARDMYLQSGGDLTATALSIEAVDAKWLDTIEGHYVGVGDDIGKEYFEQLKGITGAPETKSFDVFRYAFRTFAKLQGALQVQKIDESTKNIITDAVTVARDEGLGIADVAKAIYNKISGIGKMTARVRARNIARTETHTAYNRATQEAGDASGLDLEKEWLSAEDDRTREDHSNVDGQRVDQKGFFTVGGYRMYHPGDPDAPPEQVCNCRCATLQHAE